MKKVYVIQGQGAEILGVFSSPKKMSEYGISKDGKLLTRKEVDRMVKEGVCLIERYSCKGRFISRIKEMDLND